MTAAYQPAPDGLLVLDKPAGMTSHDVVGRVRSTLRTRKVGHAGTLDPMATGVLLVGVGRATRLLGYLTLASKAYDATIRLGESRSTDDVHGELLTRTPVGELDTEAVRAAITPMIGEITQVPAAVSAIKVGGKPSYQRVREGEPVALPSRPVTVTEFVLLGEPRRHHDCWDCDVRVQCSSGTYVRALARDLGASLGVGGHLSALRRTRVGRYPIGQAQRLDAVTDGSALLSLDELVASEFGSRVLDVDQSAVVAHGGRLAPTGRPGRYGVFDPEGRAIALVEEDDRRAQPVVVLRPA